MAVTTLAGITLIEQNQNNKFVTHNTAIEELEALALAGAISSFRSVPPASPAIGDIYIINSSPAPTGAWASRAKEVTQWTGAGWKFFAPFEGFTMYDQEASLQLTFDGSSWQVARGFTVNTVAATYTLSKEDLGQEVIISGGTGVLSIPNSDTEFPDYFECILSLDGVGAITIERVSGGGSGLIFPSGNNVLNVAGGSVWIRKRNTNIWKFSGDL